MLAVAARTTVLAHVPLFEGLDARRVAVREADGVSILDAGLDAA